MHTISFVKYRIEICKHLNTYIIGCAISDLTNSILDADGGDDLIIFPMPSAEESDQKKL